MKKKTEKSIEKLIKQPRLNVQEQVTLRKHRIKSEAIYWKRNGLPGPILDVIEKKGIDVKDCIIVEYSQDFPGINTDEGLVVTPQGHFFRFEADLNDTRTELIELYLWEDVTREYEVNDHKRGIGKTWGCLVMEVLKELNTAKLKSQEG